MDPTEPCIIFEKRDIFSLTVENDEKIKNPIYLRVARGRRSYWLKVDTSSWKISPALERMPDDARRNFTAVTLGSVIYVIGGWDGCQCDDPNPGFHTAYHYDTLHPEHGWRKAPALLGLRCYPVVFAFDGKIYAFGGACCNSDFEVYDPVENSWEALPEPYDHFDIHADGILFHAIDACNKRVLFMIGESECLYAYHFDDKSWVLANPSIGCSAYRAAVIDGVIYFVSYNDMQTGLVVRAYDLQHNKQLHCNFPPISPIVFDPTAIYLLSLGNGKLCISWNLFQKTSEELNCVLKLITLRVERIIVGEVPCYINVTQESARYFGLKGYFTLEDMVAL